MDSRQEERNELGSKIESLLIRHRLMNIVDDDGNGLPLVDALAPPGDGSIQRGKDEVEHLAGEIAWLVIPAVTANT